MYQRNRFEAAVQDVTKSSSDWLLEEFKAIIESNKPYQTKADYLGYSILSIDDKLNMVSEQIKELQQYKKRLQEAKEIVLTTGASLFEQYGITKLEGNGISSITIVDGKTDTKLEITSVANEEELINQGYYKKVLDTKKVLQDYIDGTYKDFIDSCTTIEAIQKIVPSKLRINKRRSSINSKSSNVTTLGGVAWCT